MTLDDIKNEIEKAENILIETHESPDGDAIGSSLAMMLALKIITAYIIYNYLGVIVLPKVNWIQEIEKSLKRMEYLKKYRKKS